MTCRGSSEKLTEELVEAEVGKAFETFRLAGGRYRKGALTGEESRRNMAQAFCGVFMGLFTDNMLELRLSGKNYTQFKKEYDDYLKGYDTLTLPTDESGGFLGQRAQRRGCVLHALTKR